MRIKGLAVIVMLAASLIGNRPVCADTPSRPNILFIFADDYAYNAVHALGNDEVQTPNLDRLVRSGVTFTHAYNMGSWSGAVCVASRAMLNSGRFLWHANAVHKSMEQERADGRFWSEHMKQAGYATYFTGKWHVNANADKAFEVASHVRPGMPNQTEAGYNRPIVGEDDPWKPWDPQFGGYWKDGRHWSAIVGDDAEAYFQKARSDERPFFMYLAFNAPHDPRQSPRRFVEMYPLSNIAVPQSFVPEYPFKDAIGCGKNLRDERLAPFPRTEYAVKVNRQEYYAIITHMDVQIGRILQALEDSGKAENTYIFFSADHGLAVGHHGLMGKQNMFEHSVRVPLMVVGPEVPQDQRIDERVYLQDIMASTLELAGIKQPAHVEFQSLLPIIRGERSSRYDSIYGAYLGVQRMVTHGDFKLIVYPKISKVLLYNVSEDPEELQNLAEQPAYADTIQDLFTRLFALQEQTGDTLDLKAVHAAVTQR